MTECLVIPAMGLGDWILINPIVRILSQRFDKVGLVYNDYNTTFVRHMFTDLPNVELTYNCKEWLPNVQLLIDSHCTPRGITPINLRLADPSKLDKPFNLVLYEQSGFDWDRDCKYYHIPIDDDDSYELFRSFNLPDRYAFLHEGIHPKINRIHINKEVVTFSPVMIENPFLYKYIIEHAEEIHVVDSGFYNFSDKLNLSEKIFLHKTRTKLFESPFLDPKLNQKWIEIEYL